MSSSGWEFGSGVRRVSVAPHPSQLWASLIPVEVPPLIMWKSRGNGRITAGQGWWRTSHLHLGCPDLVEQRAQVAEELDVASLVGRDRDGLCIFLNGRLDELPDRPVVTEVNHFHTGGLEDASHDVDRRVVTVEKGGRRDDTQVMIRSRH